MHHQFKTGEDLEIYEHDYESHKSLHEICKWKQPVLFQLELSKNLSPLEHIEVKDLRDYSKMKTHIDTINLEHSSARYLFHTDSKGAYLSNRNSNEIEDNLEWKRWFQQWDKYLKPHFTTFTQYDVLYGSKNSISPTMVNYESHKYLYIPRETNHSSVRVKMTSNRNKNMINVVNDYVYYEFWSSTNLFEKNEFECLDFLLKPGYVLYLPPYWFYSIQFQDNENEICMMTYTTIANFTANIHHFLLYQMQQQNIEEKWWKPLQSNIDNNNIDETNYTVGTDISMNKIKLSIEEELLEDLKKHDSKR